MKETSSTKATQTVKEVSGLIKWWYGEGCKVKERNGHIAWVMIGLPNQLLLAMDVFPIAPEQYSAACAAKQATLPFCEKAEVEGYNRYICGFCRVGLGYAARVQEEGGSAPPKAPYGGIARPDLLIGRTFCG